MSTNVAEFDINSFLKSELHSICDGIDYDAKQLLPRRQEHLIQQFLKDDKGNLIVNEKVHNIMHQFRRKAHRHGFRRLAILGCFGHGKTEQMLTGLVLSEIAKNPNILIKIVHIAEGEATNRVRAIKEYIENDEDYRKLCPHVQPTSIWAAGKFIVKRKTISKDPTVQAFPAISGSLGGRAHLIVFDDINDLKSAVLEPSTRESVEMMLKTTWMTRLIQPEEFSEAILLSNRWHENDICNYVQNSPIWAWMSVEVAEDKNCLIYKDSFGVVKPLPLWSKYPKASLINKHIEMGDRDYKRGFELKPYSDHDKTFPAFESCCRFGLKPNSIIDDPKNWLFSAGIDFSGDKRPGTMLVVGAMHKETGLKSPIEWYALKKPSDLPMKIVEMWQKYGIDLFLAENNAVQGAIIDLVKTSLDESKYQRYNIKIESFNTGKNKADPNVGLPSLQKEMENKEWIFCWSRKFTVMDNNYEDQEWRFYTEMLHHPFFKSTDYVMSLWFVREAFKRLQRSGSVGYIY